MGGLLQASRIIDAVNDRFGTLATWLVLLACLVSTGNAISRYAFGLSSNAWLELQWYMFAAMVFFGAPHTLRRNEHVRVDVFYSSLTERTRIWIDLVGIVLFLLPFCAVLIYFTWPWFLESWRIDEMSSNAGGLIRWPVKLILPLGLTLLALQGASELIKRIAALTGRSQLEHRYETPLQ